MTITITDNLINPTDIKNVYVCMFLTLLHNYQ